MLAALLFSVAMAASCPATKLVGFEGGMNNDDQTAYKSSTKRCSEIYPEAPCLKKFEKRGERNYWAICGGASEK